MIEDPTELDLSGLKCPLPVLRTRKALATARPGQQLRITCTDPLAAIDIPNFLRETGDFLEQQSQEQGKTIFLIRRHDHDDAEGPRSDPSSSSR